MIESTVNFLPGLIVLLIVLAVTLVAALVVRAVLLSALKGIDLDRRAEQAGINLAEWSPSHSPTSVIAAWAYWIVLVMGLLGGLTALDAAIPSGFALRTFEYLPHLLAAFLVLVVGSILARFLSRAVLIGAVNMQVRSARLLSVAVSWLVLVIAVAMALDHIGIGQRILLLAFGIVFGGVVLAVALAVGLGAGAAVGRAIDRQFGGNDPRDEPLDHV